MPSLQLTIQYILSFLFHKQPAAETLATSKYQLLARVSSTHPVKLMYIVQWKWCRLKARNCVKFRCKGMMGKEQCMTTVETTNNGAGARDFTDHNCACTYFIVGIIYLKHDKCTIVHYVLHKWELLPLVRFLHFSWWWKQRCVSFLSLLCKHLRSSNHKGRRCPHARTRAHARLSKRVRESRDRNTRWENEILFT